VQDKEKARSAAGCGRDAVVIVSYVVVTGIRSRGVDFSAGICDILRVSGGAEGSAV
jgi:hypothetical protein